MTRDSYRLKGHCAVCGDIVGDQTVKWCLEVKKLDKVYCFEDLPKTIKEVMRFYAEKHALI